MTYTIKGQGHCLSSRSVEKFTVFDIYIYVKTSHISQMDAQMRDLLVYHQNESDAQCCERMSALLEDQGARRIDRAAQ